MPSIPAPPRAAQVPTLFAAFGTGCLLTLMVLFNGQMGQATTPFFSSLAAHATGTIAALAVIGLLALRRGRGNASPATTKAPFWAYLGGLAGAVTVILTSVTVNSSLALSGTLALGLAGQVVFGLAADRWGLFGLPHRRPGTRDLGALALIVGGSLVIIFLGRES